MPATGGLDEIVAGVVFEIRLDSKKVPHRPARRMKPISLSFASGLTQPLSQRPHIACELPQPPARGDRLAVPVVAVARALRTASRWLARRDEARQLPPRIEHARLHRGFAHADDLGRLLDRFAVVVDEVNDLAVLRRQLCQRLAVLTVGSRGCVLGTTDVREG